MSMVVVRDLKLVSLRVLACLMGGLGSGRKTCVAAVAVCAVQ